MIKNEPQLQKDFENRAIGVYSTSVSAFTGTPKRGFFSVEKAVNLTLVLKLKSAQLHGSN